MKYTRNDVEHMAARLALACGKTWGHNWRASGDGRGNICDVGAWRIESSSPGDGKTRYSIGETSNEAGGEGNPLGVTFIGLTDFGDALYAANAAVRLALGDAVYFRRLAKGRKAGE